MSLIRKLKRALRGDVDPKTLLLETRRRARASRQSRHERANLDQLNVEMPPLLEARSSLEELLSHFRNRKEPRFLSGFSPNLETLRRDAFPKDTDDLLAMARQIVDRHSWSLLGFGVKNFGEEIEWCRDPLSGHLWPLDYHRDIQLIRNDGSDARVLWEVNRLAHLVTLARAYLISRDEKFSQESFIQLASWARQNPYGRGINWTCAMEAALRSMNLLAVFHLLKDSTYFDTDTLQLFLRLFHQHGTYIRNNLEFSHLSTSNHYLSDVTGLLWLGTMLPEFRDAEYWSDFGLTEMLREMDKQVLLDGADFESSTSYHRLVLELFLYSFILCRENGVEIPAKYWDKLHSMLEYLRGYLRPDGLAPLIGDSDSAQVLPICRRTANDHAYVLAIGSAVFKDVSLRPANIDASPELLWLLGDDGLQNFRNLRATEVDSSKAFPYAGLYVMRKDDMSLSLNTSDAGLNGRGSHGHNDALSIEVTVGSRTFIVDPGSYVYTADLNQRHLFRSTAYHSTVRIDGEEQNTTLESVPFVIGNQAKPKVIEWETSSEVDRVVAEHSGYLRLPSPVIHRRTILFYKDERYWLIEDEFFGEGEHQYEVRFHFAPDLEVQMENSSATAIDLPRRTGLSVISLDLDIRPVLESQATSSDYGEKQTSITVCWSVVGRLEKLRWKLIPVKNVR
jgi:hypothetical protein